MKTTIPTKDIGIKVKNVYNKGSMVWTFEDRIEKWIKNNMRIIE